MLNRYDDYETTHRRPSEHQKSCDRREAKAHYRSFAKADSHRSGETGS